MDFVQRQPYLEQTRLQHRSYGAVNCFLKAPFDTNGVLYHIATEGGRKPWSNPCLSRRVGVTMSSIRDGSGAPEYCVLRPEERDSDIMNDTCNYSNQWVCIDLG